MRYYFYRGEERNFGDELNAYLLPRILPDFFDGSESPLFLGIGSILFDFHPKQTRKIVFGAGYGGYTAKPVLDDTWSVYSVRGPRTAKALGIDPGLAVADLAVLTNMFRDPAPAKRFKVSFMPHFQSLQRGDWENVARAAGIHFIDPRAEVETVLEELQASELVLAEAMHGAIVADALRVPWVPLLPIDPSHRFKWYDWAEALGIDLEPQRLAPSSLFELGMNIRVAGKSPKRLMQPLEGMFRGIMAERFRDRAAASLVAASKIEPSLSIDARLGDAIGRFQFDLVKLRRDFH